MLVHCKQGVKDCLADKSKGAHKLVSINVFFWKDYYGGDNRNMKNKIKNYDHFK